MDHLNFLFVVLDSCRLDYLRSHGSATRELAEDNVWFERAIAPATWSLPSHVSIFNGDLPHKHGIYRIDHTISSLPLVDQLSSRGYRTVGVSANGFASRKNGFDEPFDEFHETRTRNKFVDGLDAHALADSLRDGGTSKPRIAMAMLGASLRNEHTLRSLGNFATVAGAHLGATRELFQRLPTDLFEPSPYYSPEANTRKIVDTIDDATSSSQPFFVFANYMDCHRPYEPPASLQRKHLGQKLDGDELDRLNDDVASPWRFIERLESDEEPDVDEKDIETIRSLYAAEVESVDGHVDRLLRALKERGLREDTLVVVTADHGENLGEVDEMGRRRLGHEGSVSDALLRVPLVVAHPSLSARTVESWTSLMELVSLFTDRRDDLDGWARDVADDQDLVLAEYPAVGGEEIFEKYPGIPEALLADRVSEHSVVGYMDEWKVVVSSTGETFVWESGVEVDPGQAPVAIQEACTDALDRLRAQSERTELSKEEVEHLEALGYM